MTFKIGTAHTRGAGYLINGVNATRPYEADIQTCAHCQAIIELQKGDFGWCQREMKPLCKPCGKRAYTHGCVPFLKALEVFTKRMAQVEAFSKAAAAMPLLILKEEVK